MNMNPKVTEYIHGQEQVWQSQILNDLRQAIHAADPGINEEIKWGTPAFDDHGPIAWMFCAQEWVHFAFPQGALLDDKHGMWDEGDDTDSKAKRTIKLRGSDKVPKQKITKLVKEAVENNRAGKKIKFVAAPKQKITLAHDIAKELKSNDLEEQYWDRPYYQQKGYVQWIDQAKQDDTRTKRIDMMIAELQNDQYMPPASERK